MSDTVGEVEGEEEGEVRGKSETRMTNVCTHDIQNIFKYCVVTCGFTFISYLNISVLYTLIVIL